MLKEGIVSILYLRVLEVPCTGVILKVGTLDPLSDAFLLVLVSNMHRNLSTEATESKQFAAFMRLMSPRLIRIRFKLEQEFITGLSSLDDPDQVSNQLAAIAVLKKYNLEELLDIFLQQKMVCLFCFLVELFLY